MILERDLPHNPWSKEWNKQHCNSFWAGELNHRERCACGIFKPPLLIRALTKIFRAHVSRGGLCSVSLTNHEFDFVWHSDPNGPIMTWDAKTQLYTMKSRYIHSLTGSSAPTQYEVYVKYIADSLWTS